jgi:ADP-ribosylglycohydrolase
MSDFYAIRDLARWEIVQRAEEGCDAEALRLMYGVAESESDYAAILHRAEALTPDAGYPYFEPSEYDDIQDSRPAPPILSPPPPEVLRDRIYGALLGRCAGCALGKPVEGWSRARIWECLGAVGAFPLCSYIPESALIEQSLGEEDVWRFAGVKERLCEMPVDDDINYTLLALHILESYGPEFSADNVAFCWQKMLPFLEVHTAERIAYRNLANGISPPLSARIHNPYREWIGAQIRADGYGFASPGNLERAASWAYKDASVSHTRNGLYGAMWVAATVSAAFCVNSPEEAIRAGLSVIPPKSRLFEAISNVLDWRADTDDWQECLARIDREFGDYHWVHTINNAAHVAMALLFGRDFAESCCIAVMGGLDTDCNGATCGSVLGALCGAANLPAAWTHPLNNTIRSTLYGYDRSPIDAIASRFFALAQSW